MTDNQIIIDRVDVSKCEHYEDLECSIYKTCCGYPLYCADRPNCYYKQRERKKQECEELQRKIIKIVACLIKANRANKILDTLWVDDITTLWDYIALTLGIDGDQTQIEEQVLQNERGAK